MKFTKAWQLGLLAAVMSQSLWRRTCEAQFLVKQLENHSLNEWKFADKAGALDGEKPWAIAT